MTVDVAAMQAVVPASVIRVCEVLRRAGHQGWVVGGAVRDLALGKRPSDWDVASDALPEAVLELFPKTIATGLQHGTVTVLMGKGASREAIEVTTFRGEGAYTDARRPDDVHFGVPLDEDLKRRDFVMNAMAFDPLESKIHDPFGGVADLEAKVVRAVGIARERFEEDGLRIMRAVRFVSVLDFSLDPASEEALAPCLSSLEKVAQERVRVELFKLLSGQSPERGLTIAERSGILATILPELSSSAHGVPLEQVLARLTATKADPVLRLASLLLDLKPTAAEAACRRLTLSNEERQRVVGCLQHVATFPADVEGLSFPHQLRQHLSKVGRRFACDQLAVVRGLAHTVRPELNKAVAAAQVVLDSGQPIEVKELAIGGKELLALGVSGPRVGIILRSLLDDVLLDPSNNDAARLQERARQLASDA